MYIYRHHLYQRIWNPKLAKVAIAVWERENCHDSYAVAIFRRNMLYRGAFAIGDLQRAFLFAENGWSDQSQNK